jgi:hypothetical protein
LKSTADLKKTEKEDEDKEREKILKGTCRLSLLPLSLFGDSSVIG